MGIHYDVGSRRNKRDVKGGAQKRMQRTPRKEKVVPVQMGYYLPTMKKDTTDFVKKCHSCQVQANLIHSTHQVYIAWSLHGPSTPKGSIW